MVLSIQLVNEAKNQTVCKRNICGFSPRNQNLFSFYLLAYDILGFES